MPVKPFAYNTGGPISGTTQYGNLVVGDIDVDYSSDYGGLKWWGGPEESELLGYVIGTSNPSGQPIPSGVTGPAYVGFWRSEFHTDESFLNLANYIGAENGQPPFATTADAENWLQSNGYYTSYNLPTPTPTSTITPTPTITPTTTITPSITQTVTPTITVSITPTQTPTPSVTSTITPTTTPTTTPTVTPTPSITNTQTPTTTPTVTPTITPSTSSNIGGFSYSNFASTAGLSLLGNATVSSNILSLTTAGNNQIGNVYRTSAIRYDRSFSAQWSTFIGGGTGADGYCVQWTSTNNTTGTSGGGVGLIQSVGTINAITFLTFTNNSYNWYKNNVLQSANSVTAGLWRQTLYFWGDYNHSAQTFALSWNTTNTKPGSPNKTFTSFSFDTGSYYMGFGAATGGSNDNHQVNNWTLQFT